MRVRLLTDRVLASGLLQQAGSEVDMDPREADRMILSGQAEPIAAGVERAVVHVTAETTSETPGEPRKRARRGERT